MSAQLKFENYRPNKVKSQQVLAYCERSFLEQISNGFDSNLENVLLEIKKNMQSSKSYEERTELQELYINVKQKRSELVSDFQQSLRKNFKDSLNNLNKKTPEKKSNLSIMTNEEEDALISKMKLEKKIESLLGDELQNLAIRVEMLIGEERNPFSPEVLSSALSASINKILTNRAQQTKALNMIASAWPTQVMSTFQGINSYLIANDVIPDIETFRIQHGIKRKEPTKDEYSDDSSMIHSYSKNNNQVSAPKAPITNQMASNFFETKSNLDTLFNLDLPPLPSVLNKAAPINSKEELDLNKKASYFQNLMSEFEEKLSQVQSLIPAHVRESKVSPTPTEAPKASVLNNDAILNSINALQKQFLQLSLEHSVLISNQASNVSANDIMGGMHIDHKNVMHDLATLRDDTLAKKDTTEEEVEQAHKDQLIIDLLSIMFDRVFEHENLPEHIKYMIGKLQIPILKVCLVDKEFFSNEENPIRLFLDCLATSNTLYNIEYQNRFEEIINTILQKEKINNQVFDEALKSIQVMLQDYENKENTFINKVSEEFEIEEKSHIFLDHVLNGVSKTISRATYAPLRKFIETSWAKGFSKKWASSSQKIEEDFMKTLSLEAKVSLNQSLLVFDMIIWATNLTENTVESAEKLRNYIPKISQGFNELCDGLNISTVDRDNFLFLLAQRNLAFLKSQKGTDLERILKLSEKNEEKILKLFDKNLEIINQNKNATKEIEMSQNEFYTEFSKGRWFEFGPEKTKVRLVWISPQNSIFLFNNPINKKVYKFEKSKVWSQYNTGHLKPIGAVEKFSSRNLISDSVEFMKRQVNLFN